MFLNLKYCINSFFAEKETTIILSTEDKKILYTILKKMFVKKNLKKIFLKSCIVTTFIEPLIFINGKVKCSTTSNFLSE